MNRRAYGAAGEREAADYLADIGATVRARNYRCPMGEVDLIVELNGAIVFVEVKRRGGDAFGRPAEAVDRGKRDRIARTAMWYLRENGLDGHAVRFDVVEVFGGRVRHIPAAFLPLQRR